MSQEEFALRSQNAYHESSRYDAGGRAWSRATTPEAQELSRKNAGKHYVTLRKKKRRKRVLKGLLVTFLLLLVSCAVAAVAYIAHINGKITKHVDQSLLNVLTDTQDNDPFYMLLLGTDKDGERTESADYGSDFSAYRTDTIILARVDPSKKKVTLISIPRDTYVDMGENGSAKINSAYSFGGAAYATQVVSKFAGVPISHYAEVDMDGFAAIVDQLGGVTVNLPVEVKDPYYTGLDLPAGEQTLDGQTAALLGRSRHAYDNYGGGDFYRAANQRMLIGAVIKKVMSSNPLTLAGTVSTLAGYVTTDMDVSSIAGLATRFLGMDVDKDIYSGQCPTISQLRDEVWYEFCDTARWKEIMGRVDKGLPPYTDTDQDFTSGVAGSVGQSTGDSATNGTDGSGEVKAEHSGSVLVLNGAGIQGIASQVSNRLEKAGFSAMADNADARTDTLVVYNEGARGKAAGVIEDLGLSSEPVANDGSWSTGVDVVVVIGSSWAK